MMTVIRRNGEWFVANGLDEDGPFQTSAEARQFRREVDELMRMCKEDMDGDEIVGHRDGGAR